MKDAVGGSILFYIILIFIAIFIMFIAVIMNYAEAYRTNNYVVNTIEQYEGRKPLGTKSDTTSTDSLYGYLKRHRYFGKLDVTCTNIPDDTNPKGSVFGVTTYIKFYIPFVDVGFDIPIKNDTKTIYGIKCSDATVKSAG